MRKKLPAPCAVEGCDRLQEDRDWCHRHYENWRRNGNPVGRQPRPAIERFFDLVEVTESCWLWRGYTNPAGYGRFYASRAGRSWLAHRTSYTLLVGPIPAGLHLDHLCRVRACVNPEHLEPVTLAENSRRAAAVKTHCPQGHAYDEANTYTGRGHRECRACHREKERTRQRSMREAARA